MHSIAENQKIGPKLTTVFGAPEGQDARILADHAHRIMPDDKILIHIALDDARLKTLEHLLNFFAPEVQVIAFPAWDCLPYDRVSPHSDIVAQRVASLTQIIEWKHTKARKPRIILVSVNSAIQRVMPLSSLREASFYAEKGSQINLEALQLFLSQSGYLRNQTVRDSGEYAIRGGIIDLFPAGFEKPVRIDLFGDEVESIKTFDPLSQCSENEIDKIQLQPVTEFFLDEDSIARFRSRYRELFGAIQKGNPVYESISEGRRYSGMEHWLPLFHENMETLFDYAHKYSIYLDPHIPEAFVERQSQILDFYESRKAIENTNNTLDRKNGTALTGSVYHALPVKALYLDDTEWHSLISEAQIFSPFAASNESEKNNYAYAQKGRDFSDIRANPKGDIFAALKSHISDLQKNKTKVLIASYSEGSRSRLIGLMKNAHITNLIEINNKKGLKELNFLQVGVSILELEQGFAASDLAVITEQDILGDRLARKQKKARKADNFLREVSALSEGDLVVHIDHGIGRFLCLETLEAAGNFYDCLKIEYAGGDRLYVPVVNLEVLSRFGSDEGTVQLDKLGGAGWQARKAKAKKNLLEIADKLLGIAAARQLKKAQKLRIGEDLYNEFAARFPYQETDDQDRAIHSVLDGIAGSYPMDHLVCGDVGFGKTEIALRAAYVAAMSGVQVALAVPTTLLARQHYNNFQKRFTGTGIRIAQLSRLVNTRDNKLAKEGIENGSVQIAIGTHALFAKNLKFKNLGLLIVDEEQRFGVKQKEKLKELKSNIHVLTLTATPIPRTLQMSLTGVKEMSLITTPPVDRLAIRTFVLPYDPVVIRDALLREHYRGGQSFYVVPRIKDLKEISAALKELVPEIKFIEAHGQMNPNDLEDRMTAFCDGQYDVLLATNIIESGIDIPSANTLIVHRSDMFGLSQLYQIRGRIGRSKQRAYAYLTYQPGIKLNPNAQKRLEVMETLDTLGSGFQLASHDMDIRGAGNLLGDQQSGHIREIGVELYQQMLEEAVAAARSGIDSAKNTFHEEHWSPQINLGASVLIPESYVEDLDVRMSLYRRLNDVDDVQGMEGFAAEMIDRFGDLPDEVENLLKVLEIKSLCKNASISQIDAGPKGAIITFHNNTPLNIDALMHWISTKAGTVKIRPDQKISIMRSWEKVSSRINGVQTLVKELSQISS